MFILQVTLSCDADCGELEQYVANAPNITSITVNVEEMCAENEDSTSIFQKIEIRGDYVKPGGAITRKNSSWIGLAAIARFKNKNFNVYNILLTFTNLY